MGVLCIFWIIKSLPSLPCEPSHQKQNTFRLLQRPGVMAGMIAIFMSFAGRLLFTYIRPVYMNLAGFGVDGLTGAAEFWYRQLCRDIAFVVYSQTFGETGLSGRTVCARPERAGTDAVGKR